MTALSKSKLRNLFLQGHITYKEYIAEIDRLDGMREKLYALYLNKQITYTELKDMLAELDRKDDSDISEPPTIY